MLYFNCYICGFICICVGFVFACVLVSLGYLMCVCFIVWFVVVFFIVVVYSFLVVFICIFDSLDLCLIILL